MAGTKEGARKAALTNKLKHGPDFYANIGARGGRNGHTGGFASTKVSDDGLTGPERAKLVGARGGAISRRGPSKNKQEETYYD